MDDKTLHTQDYLTEFGTNDYLGAYTRFKTIPWFMEHIKGLVRVFVKNSSHLGHERALEFGGGPTLVSSFVIAQYVQSITFSEYVPNNLKAINDWVNQVEDAFDWTDVFNFIIEQYHQQTGITLSLSECEQRLRTDLQRGGVLQIGDVNKQSGCAVLDNPANYNQFDIILSSFCLEDACLTKETYEKTVERLCTLLKPGGFLVLAHGRNQTFYYVADKRFFAQYMNEQSARETLERMKLINIQSSAVDRTPNMYSDSDGYFIVCGYKMK
ncbi:hypothetical protein I4U23_031448 [Adineta vaga]|nr:hypothetical protein I4U23_031448 [Adineta vaga]